MRTKRTFTFPCACFDRGTVPIAVLFCFFCLMNFVFYPHCFTRNALLSLPFSAPRQETTDFLTMLSNNTSSNSKEGSTSGNATLVLRATEAEETPPTLSMSLIGLQERALHYQDLVQRLHAPASGSTPPPPSSNTLAPLAVQPGQDPREAFRNHLLSVLEEAVRIINEEE